MSDVRFYKRPFCMSLYLLHTRGPSSGSPLHRENWENGSKCSLSGKTQGNFAKTQRKHREIGLLK